MFATLTGEDLLELNVNAFGARKRLMLAINQLKVESEQSSEWIQLSDFKDIPSLFNHLEMGHLTGLPEIYSLHLNILQFQSLSTENFIQNEIDLKTFLTLTSHDLLELGVKPFYERKRLLLAIGQLKSERFAGSAAPGAERRPSNGTIQEPKIFM